MKLLAGRVGQLMDYTSLANDVGVSAKTIKHWLSILEASFCCLQATAVFRKLWQACYQITQVLLY